MALLERVTWREAFQRFRRLFFRISAPGFLFLYALSIATAWLGGNFEHISEKEVLDRVGFGFGVALLGSILVAIILVFAGAGADQPER